MTQPNELAVYIGTYAPQMFSRAIYHTRFNLDTGMLSVPELVAEVDQPSWLTAHPSLPILYAASSTDDFEGHAGGAVSAYAIDPSNGRLTLRGWESSGGMHPCHLVVAEPIQRLLVTNYGSGSLSALPIRDDGTLAPVSDHYQSQGSSIDPDRQQHAHLHSSLYNPRNGSLLVADLGSDTIWRYTTRSSGEERLNPENPPALLLPPGTGPRHMALHPKGRFMLVNGELDNRVHVFSMDPDSGDFEAIGASSTLPDSFSGVSYTAEIAFSDDGLFLYVSNRGHDSLAVFSFDDATGQLTLVAVTPIPGVFPRHFKVLDDYVIVANQGSDTLVVFRRDRATGKVAYHAEMSLPAPTCVCVVG